MAKECNNEASNILINHPILARSLMITYLRITKRMDFFQNVFYCVVNDKKIKKT